MDTKNIEGLKEFLSVTRKVAITCHFKPDGDAIGSALGLYHYLNKLGHEVFVIVPSEVPEFISWLPGNDHVVCYSEETIDVCNDILEDSEILFCLDFNALHRVGPMESLITDRDLKYVMIDHHLEPDDFDDFRFWSSDAAATAELIYLLVEKFGDTYFIEEEAADCLYTGIMTDTGSFRHSNTTEQVHRVTAELIARGADNSKIHRKVYDTNTESRLRILGFALAEKLVILKDSHTAYMSLEQDEMDKFNPQSGDTEGLVNYALSLDGIIFAALIKAGDGYSKLSLRSKGTFAANEIAGEYFSGGGHRNASGGKFDGSVTDTINHFEKAVKENKEALDLAFNELAK